MLLAWVNDNYFKEQKKTQSGIKKILLYNKNEKYNIHTISICNYFK